MTNRSRLLLHSNNTYTLLGDRLVTETISPASCDGLTDTPHIIVDTGRITTTLIGCVDSRLQSPLSAVLAIFHLALMPSFHHIGIDALFAAPSPPY
jgi:hypothetical protein